MAPFGINGKRVRPAPLLDSDSSEEDLITPQFGKRISYLDIVDTQEISPYHMLVALFVAMTTYCYHLQTFSTIVLIPKIACEWSLTLPEISMFAISLSLLSFMAPLIQTVLTHLSLRIRISLLMMLHMVILLVSAASSNVEELVVMRGVAGLFIIPESLLSRLWSHIFPQQQHLTMRRYIGLARSMGVVSGVALPLMLYSSVDVKTMIVLPTTVLVVPIFLSYWVIETPLMLLMKGKYSSIMDAMATAFHGDEIRYLRLQEIDFRVVSMRLSWDPIYLFNERTNNMNCIFVFVYKIVQGFMTTVVLCTLSVFYMDTASCKTALHTPACTPHLAAVIILTTLTALLATDFTPYVSSKLRILLFSLIGAVSFAIFPTCTFSQTGMFILTSLIYFSLSMLGDVISLVSSTLSISIAGECFSGLVYIAGTILGKIIYDHTPQLPCYIASGLMLVVFMTGFFHALPVTKDACNVIEMEDPVETVVMQMELTNGDVESVESEEERDETET